MPETPTCPECGEPAIRAADPRPDRYPATFPPITWTHLDGEPLCPVIGPDGYQPAEPDLPPTVRVIGPDQVGSWLEGSALRTDDELSVAVIRLAAAYGMRLPYFVTGDLREHDKGEAGPELARLLTLDADSALDFLNALCPEGLTFEINDGLVLYTDSD